MFYDGRQGAVFLVLNLVAISVLGWFSRRAGVASWCEEEVLPWGSPLEKELEDALSGCFLDILFIYYFFLLFGDGDVMISCRELMALHG